MDFLQYIFERLKSICSIKVKHEGRAFDVIFILCLICIVSFSIFLYRSSTNFYGKLDKTMQDNVNFNLEVTQNEQVKNIQDFFNRL